MQAALLILAAPAQGILASSTPQGVKPTPVLRNPVLFAGRPVAERYQVWADDGQHSGVKSKLTMILTMRGLALPKTGHEGTASNNLSRNGNLPEALDGLIHKSLTRETAIALVERVVSILVA